MLQKAENITFNYLPYPMFSELAESPEKYKDKGKNAYESSRRLAKLPLIQTFSNSICFELGLSQVILQPTGSAKAGYANKESDLDIYAQISQEDFLNNREIRNIFAMKMQFLLRASKNIDFPVYIFFVSN